MHLRPVEPRLAPQKPGRAEHHGRDEREQEQRQPKRDQPDGGEQPDEEERLGRAREQQP